MWTGAQESISQFGAGLDHVLAIVKDQEQFPPTDGSGRGDLDRFAGMVPYMKRLGYRRSNQRIVGYWGEIGKPDAPISMRECGACQLKTQACLAHAAGAGERQKSRSSQLSEQIDKLMFAPHKAAELCLEVVRWLLGRGFRAVDEISPPGQTIQCHCDEVTVSHRKVAALPARNSVG
jgi:hypothetical protein